MGKTVALFGTFSGGGEGTATRLRPREFRYMEALARGATQGDAAKAAKVSIRTARRWAHKPEIVAAVKARQEACMAQTRAVLVVRAAGSAESLADMADGTREADSARVAACKATIGLALELGELEDVRARLDELEAKS